MHYLVIAAASALVLAAVPLVQAQPTAVALQVRIGTVSPLSGPSAHSGKDIENGARMAIDELNAKGIALGGNKVQWVLQPEDDGADPKTGVAVAQKLVDAKVSAVVGHLNSGTTVPASKITPAQAFHRFRRRPRRPSTPTKVSRRRSAWSRMTT